MNERIIIAVDIDYFFAQCEEVRRPEIQGKPVVICVYSGRTELSGVVSTSNYVARALGVESGIPISAAKRRLSNTDAVFLSVDQEYYKLVSDRIMGAVHSFSEYFEQVSIDEAFLDVTNATHRDYESAIEIGRKIKDQIKDLEKLTCSVGIARNKLLAKMAADSQKPDGLSVLHPDEISVFLDPLPIGKLPGVGPKTEKRMKELGIETISTLAHFDPGILADEFGRNLGPQLARLAQGLDDEPVREREPEQFSRIVTLKRDATSFNFENELRSMTGDISRRLRSSNSKCKVVGIIVITTNLKTKHRARTLDVSIDSEQEIFAVTSELFKSYFESENSKTQARRVGIRVSNLVSSERQESVSNLSEFF